MPRRARALTAQEVRAISKAGCFSVGGVAGLLLQVSEYTAKSWILRTKVGIKRREIGLGSYPEVSLKQARETAAEFKAQIREGIDPVLERQRKKEALIRSQRQSVTFREVAEQFIEKKTKEFKVTSKAKQRQRLENGLKNHAYDRLAKLPIADIEREHILQVLEPIWDTKTATAERLRNNLERILDLAEVMGLRKGSNPARWLGNLSHILPAPNKVSKVQHMKALPVDELPAFMKRLRQIDSVAAKALRFAILTCARSSQVRLAEWSELDLEKRVWTVADHRMKQGKAHRVPLCDEAIELLNSIKPDKAVGLVFVNINKPLSENGMTSVIKKVMGLDVTQHGFRSTFKDWARTHTRYPDEASELALAHVNDDKTRAAYARDELLELRARMMNDWGEYCLNGKQPPAKVTKIKA